MVKIMKNKEKVCKEFFEKAYSYVNEKAGRFYVASNCAAWKSGMVVAIQMEEKTVFESDLFKVQTSCSYEKGIIVETICRCFKMENGLCTTNEKTIVFKAMISINKELIEKAIAANISEDKLMEIVVKHVDEIFEKLNQKNDKVIKENISALSDKEKKNIEVPIIM